jgi:hypothetical protein
VPARQHVGLHPEAFARQSLLELHGKEPVLGPSGDPDRDGGQRGEVTHGLEGGVRFIALIRLSFGDDRLGHVVREVGGQVDLGAVAAPLGGGNPGLGLPGGIPPGIRRLAGCRDHRVHENDRRYWRRRHERRGETAERLRDEHHVGVAVDRGADHVGVLGQPRVRVVGGQVDGDRVVPGLTQQRDYPVPVPGHAARARDQYECRLLPL